MVALGLVNLLNIILCIYNTTAYRQNHARIVTPANQQLGTVRNQSFIFNNISMFPSNSNANGVPTPTLNSVTPLATEVVTSPTSTFYGITFPPNINVFLNITSNNGFIFTPSTSPSTIESTAVPNINVILSHTDQTDSDLGLIDTGDNTNQQPAQVIENKMIFEEKCEEYYNMGNRKTRKATVQVFIAGGTNSLPKEFPHMAALAYGKGTKKEWLCGGSLISENYVVTAAHCLSSKTLGNVEFVRLGTTNLQTETLDSADYNVIKRIPHPDYKKDEQYNDIALLQLEHPVTFSDGIAPICLHPTKNISMKKLIATGWGKTESAGTVSPELQKVELEYFSNNECQLSYAVISKEDLPRGIVEDIQICAGSRKEEKDTCQGDSGGPLQFQDNGRMYLVGITSFGIGCGKAGSPGVYTRVSHFIPWMQRIVWGK